MILQKWDTAVSSSIELKTPNFVSYDFEQKLTWEDHSYGPTWVLLNKINISTYASRHSRVHLKYCTKHCLWQPDWCMFLAVDRKPSSWAIPLLLGHVTTGHTESVTEVEWSTPIQGLLTFPHRAWYCPATTLKPLTSEESTDASLDFYNKRLNAQ